MNGPVIEAEAVSRRYGKVLAVDSVSFRVDEGLVCGLLGTAPGSAAQIGE